MTRIFISYRRADSQHVTDRLYETLEGHFGAGNVFQDVDRIPIGVDFVAYLRQEIEKADVVLVVIGPDWSRIMQERASQTSDFVRVEVEQSFKLGKVVIPVTVMGAQMPAESDLPESIRPLCRINAALVRPNPDWKKDCQVLADGIRQLVVARTSTPRTVTNRPKTVTANAVRAIIGEPFDWCDVPAGEYIYGTRKREQKLTLPAFAIAKYPITYSQYKVFIDDKEGFHDPRWWEGLAEGQPDEPGEQWPIVNDHPRDEVSWYDAVAFCRWLSWRLLALTPNPSPSWRGEFDLMNPATWLVRLPTEFEWEKAARGADGRMYPWGNEFDSSRCNSAESGIVGATPVTQYPQGASPYGVLDMSGNVWEWCLTRADNPSMEVTAEDVRLDSWRVLRGGSQLKDQGNIRTVSRYVRHPAEQYKFGFRVVRA